MEKYGVNEKPKEEPQFRLNRILKRLRFPNKLIALFLPRLGTVVTIGNVVFVVTYSNVGKRRVGLEVRGWMPPPPGGDANG
jgi:hypothetical protein